MSNGNFKLDLKACCLHVRALFLVRIQIFPTDSTKYTFELVQATDFCLSTTLILCLAQVSNFRNVRTTFELRL